jgi:mono/diheme cytochrome c family protein
MTSGQSLTTACALLATLAVGCTRPAPPAPPATESKPALPTIALKELPAFPLKAHVESADIANGAYTVERLVDAGGDLFHTPFNGLDGVGSFVREDGSKVARFAPLGPRGPSSQACGECHAEPFPTSAGLAHSAVVRAKKGTTSPLNVRSVTSVFGNGILQLLAQEMTEDLWTARDEATSAAKAAPGTKVTRPLASKGTSFGSIAMTATPAGEVTVDISKVVGVDPDLVIRPLGWKGDVPILRNFSVGAAAGAMGLVADELVWKKAGAGKHPDVDGDGVGRELSVGDITAMTVYMAAQETPTEASAMATLGYAQALSADDAAKVEAGRKVFAALGCATCHTPEMPLLNTRFEEPTLRGRGQYYDAVLAKLDPAYDPKRPFTFDILKEAQPPRAEARAGGGATIRLYGDLKRHAMGRLLADPAGTSDSIGADLEPLKHDGKVVSIPADQFLTAELWGVGNTGPWLHDNRAGTLREAVLLHGEDAPPAAGAPGRSEAQEARDAFAKASAADQESLVAFLLSLRTFSPEKP